ncbi:MAG: hypothetical protein OER91_14165 [Gammaproteobacteria bacterium]|nr:hypothetical protein [Gammaproteobacteria bacterium]
MTKQLLNIALALFVLGVAGCAAPPQLPERSAANPARIDLSGQWKLRTDPNAPSARPERQEEMIRLPPASSRRRQQVVVHEPRNSKSKGPSVHVFIETGKALKITQTEHGLFISFDRAVVEEFTFGENRLVSVGPIEAQRVSGWEGPIFIVETMDAEGATLRETWTLTAGAGRGELMRDIEIVDDDQRQLSFKRQVFDRS